MNNKQNYPGIKIFTARKRKLPHWQQPGSFYYITFSTLKHRRLGEESKSIVMDALMYYDGTKYELISAVVMKDHCHCVIHPLEKEKDTYWDISEILKSIKGCTSREINKIEEKTGSGLWLKESYDRIIRDDDEMERFLQYIDENAIKAGLSDRPGAYKWYYFTEKYL